MVVVLPSSFPSSTCARILRTKYSSDFYLKIKTDM
jgi:hypothetical protein